MSDLNIRLNLDSTAAAAAAAGVQDDLNKLKTDAEKPIKIKVDSSQLAGAAGNAGKLQEALGNVQAAALGELSQKAAQLGAGLGGVAGSLAEVAIKSAAAFGPIGIAITAVLAGLALVKQAVDENNAATKRTEEITQGLADANRVLGGTYSTVTAAANAATTAEAARLAIAREIQAIGREQLGLIGQGADVSQAETLTSGFQALSDATKDVRTNLAVLTPAMIQHAVVSGNAAEQTAVLGMSFVRAREPAVAMAQATELVLRRLRELANNERTNAQERVRVAREAVAYETSRRVEGELALERYQRIVAAETRVVTARNQLTTATDAAATAEQNFANQQNQVVIAGTQAAEAAAALEAARRRQAAEAAASASAETALQRRMGEEALRLAEQTYAQNGRTLTLFEQKRNAMQALSFAEQELTRARAASESHGQTAAERTQLITSLNNEATARQAVADATQAQADRLGTLMERATSRTDPDAHSQAEELRFQQSLTRIQQEQRMAEGASKAQDAARAHTLQQQGTFTGRMTTLMGQQKGTTEQLAGSAKNALTAVGTAMASHAQAMIQGKEDIGDALQGMLKDVLSSIGSEAMIKGAMMMAEGAAALAGIYTAPLAAGNFAAGAAFFGVGALASAAGAAIPASASAGGGGGGASAGAASSASTSHSETPMRSGGSSAAEAPSNITINMNAFQSNDQAQALIVRSLREAGYRNIR